MLGPILPHFNSLFKKLKKSNIVINIFICFLFLLYAFYKLAEIFRVWSSSQTLVKKNNNNNFPASHSEQETGLDEPRGAGGARLEHSGVGGAEGKGARCAWGTHDLSLGIWVIAGFLGGLFCTLEWTAINTISAPVSLGET